MGGGMSRSMKKSSPVYDPSMLAASSRYAAEPEESDDAPAQEADGGAASSSKAPYTNIGDFDQERVRRAPMKKKEEPAAPALDDAADLLKAYSKDLKGKSKGKKPVAASKAPQRPSGGKNLLVQPDASSCLAGNGQLVTSYH
jgi:hypothetical protein